MPTAFQNTKTNQLDGNIKDIKFIVDKSQRIHHSHFMNNSYAPVVFSRE